MKRRTREEERIAKQRQRAAAKLRKRPKSFRLRDMPGILPFQKEWLDKAFAKDIDLAALSAARGSGKTTLAGWIASCAVAPSGAVHAPSGACLIVAPTFGQGREVLIAARGFLEGVDPIYAGGIAPRVSVSAICRRRLSAGSSPRLPRVYWAMARIRPTIIFDEVAAAGAKGRAIFDAMVTGLGKRQGQRLIALGTRSPSGPADWWPDWLSSTKNQPRTHIQTLEGDPENWRDPGEAVRRPTLWPLAILCGPCWDGSAPEAETDPSALARYRAYRLNHSSDPIAARVFSDHGAGEGMRTARTTARRRADPVGRHRRVAFVELRLRDLAGLEPHRIVGNRGARRRP